MINRKYLYPLISREFTMKVNYLKTLIHNVYLLPERIYIKIYLQLAVIQRDLHRVEEWFKEDPALFNVPTDLKALSSSVVSFGSQIQDLSTTVKALKESNARVQDVQTTMQQNITSIKVHNQTFHSVTLY